MGSIDIAGPAGRLEALLEEVPAPRFAALVCHPHPLFGGTMHNHATYRLARALRAAGGASLRLNYRGVGRSAGAYDRGRGEADDAAAGLALLAARWPGLPRLACGFSFGAHAAVAAGLRDEGVAGLMLAGLVVVPRDDVPRDLARLVATPRPVVVVQAERDEFGAPQAVGDALAGSAGERLLLPVAGASHLFEGKLDELQQAAEDGARWLLRQAGIPEHGPGTGADGRG
jgi:alpha/beta superfamily hydrolase